MKKQAYFGPKEIEVISRLSYEKTNVITKEQFDELFKKSLLTRQIIYQLRKKGILKPINKGVYYFSPIESGPNGRRINEFLIPSILFPKGNYYLGFGTMYNYYGFTEQIFQTFYVLNTSIQRERIIDGKQFKLRKVKESKLYGLTKITIRDSDVIVSDRERTLIDLIYFPDPVGGLTKAFEIFTGQIKKKKADIKKIIRYAIRFPNITTRKRIGFVLETCGVSSQLLKPLRENLKDTSLITLYGSKSRKGSINTTWKVIVDDSQS